MSIGKVVAKKNRAANVLDKRFIKEYLQGERFNKILDTGCGGGDFTEEIGKLVHAKEVHGVEIMDNKAKEARERGIKIEQTDLNGKLPYRASSFDLILSVQNIEHLYFTDDYLSEMHRILKKDGEFILTTTNLAAIHYRILLLFGVQPICLHPSEFQTWPLSGRNPRWGHKSIFTFPALREVLQKHGFKIVKEYTHTMYFIPTFISRIILKVLPNFGTFSCFVVKRK